MGALIVKLIEFSVDHFYVQTDIYSLVFNYNFLLKLLIVMSQWSYTKHNFTFSNTSMIPLYFTIYIVKII